MPLPVRAVLMVFAAAACLLLAGDEARAEIELPLGDVRENVLVSAQRGYHWKQGAYDVWLLQGACRLRQGKLEAQANEAVLWIEPAPASGQQPTKIIAYLDGDVLIDFGHNGAPHQITGKAARTLVDQQWLGRFYTVGSIEYRVPWTEGKPPVAVGVLDRGHRAREPGGGNRTRAQETGSGGQVRNVYGTDRDRGATRVAQAQMQLPAPPASSGPTISARHVQVLPRSGNDLQAESFNDPVRDETVVVATMGVAVLIDDVRVQGVSGVDGNLGTVEIQADNVVLWTKNLAGVNLFGEVPNQPQTPPGDLPLELYLEGNIVFRQGRRVLYADRMYYHVNREYGVVLNAEVLTPVTNFEGLVRLKADVLHQLDSENFAAYGAAITSSRIGQPRYWLQSEELTLRDVQQVRMDPVTGLPLVDPVTGQADVEHQLLATSRNNFVYVASTPVAYWPVMASDLRRPTYYIDRVKLNNDDIFGTQVMVDLNAYQLFGFRDPPEGTDWTISADYLSERGPATGSHFDYNRPDFLGFNTPVHGILDTWIIKDEGLDNLGRDRRALVPEEEYRGRLWWQHRQFFSPDLQLTAAAGLISDRNFLEQYFEQEWDTFKDQTTGFELKQYLGHNTLSLSSDVRVNDFFTQTNWLPRADHFLIGHSIGEMFTWHAHSHVGYANLETATAPTNPVDAAKFDPLAWELPREGVRGGTRQELDLPLDVGPVKIVPYVLGEAMHWGEDLTGEDVTRLYGQAGVRTSLPMWTVNPEIRSSLLNLNGLAHKISFDSELFYADANQDLSRFPLYDPLDDDSIEFFRRRFFFDTFGGAAGGNVPLRFDERFFALRSGMQSWVASPSTEIADDMLQANLAVRQRWQTKRGLPGQERIIDWIVLDIESVLFPEADRDNFGEEVGLVSYDFRWHVGDRLTLLSDGYSDFFDDALRTVSVGGLLSRPDNGRLYLGYRSIEGPFSSHLLTGSMSYRMSEKWVMTAGANIDLGDTGNVTEALALTRIGESALIRFGFNHNESRDNVGVQLTIEPRFLPGNKLGRIGGIHVPPAGAMGLE